MAVIRVALWSLLPLALWATSDADKAELARLRAQHTADVAMVDILKLQAARTHANVGKQATATADLTSTVQDSESQIIATTESTHLAVLKLSNERAAIQTPLWIAVSTGLVAIVLAFFNRSKLSEVHTLTNSNLNEVKSDLKAAMEKIIGLEKLITVLETPSAHAVRDIK